MKRLFLISLFIFIIVVLLLAWRTIAVKPPVKTKEINISPAITVQNKEEANMKIISSTFSQNQKIPVKYTCDGENVSPPLEFNGMPQDTRSLALIMDDPDAPMGTWVHWLLWNMPPQTAALKEGGVPQGATQGKNSAGENKYSGPCPPSGTHRYFFKLYALDSFLDLPGSTDKASLEKTMEGHILESAELIGLYR